MPDVVCDWRDVTLEQAGPDLVRVSGARGRPPTSTYKATVTQIAGYRSMTTALFAGLDAGAKARRLGEAIVARSERLIAEAGHAPFAESSVEVIGAGDTAGPEHRHDDATEAIVKVGVRHESREALEVFSREFAPMALVAQGMTGFFAGRPRVAPSIRVMHLLVDKAFATPAVRLGEHVREVAVAPAGGRAPETEPLAEPVIEPPADGAAVQLRRLAYARSGDKGDQANIGLIARRPEFARILRDQVTAARVAEVFGQYLTGTVRRWDMPGLDAINILLDGVLGGAGGTSTLRYDPQAKSYGAMLLGLEVIVPSSWLRDGLVEEPPA
jgi:hypothetical protein